MSEPRFSLAGSMEKRLKVGNSVEVNSFRLLLLFDVPSEYTLSFKHTPLLYHTGRYLL